MNHQKSEKTLAFAKMADFSVRCIKISGTIALYFSFFTLGLCVAIPGPTLLDLQQIVQTDTSKIAFIYLARSGGYLIGSLIGGILFDMIKRKEFLLTFCNFIMALSSLATPWSRSVLVLMGVLAVGGVSMGALDTGANVLCLNIWGRDSPPYFQALHFLFGLGSFLAPLIAAPFLSNYTEKHLFHKLSSNESVISPSNITNFEYTTLYINETNFGLTVPLVTYTYTIIGGFAMCVTLIFFIISFSCPQKQSYKHDTDTDNLSEPNIIFSISVIIIVLVLLSIYCGIELGYGQMIATFAVKGDLKLTKSVGSFLTALFWGTFTFSRGLSVFLSAKLSPFTIVILDLIIIMFGGITLAIFGNVYTECLWASTVLLAVGLASFYPTVISWIERYINVTNKVASLFVIAGAAGEMVIPLVVSQFIETIPVMFMYIIFGCAILVCIMTFLLWFILTRRGEKYSLASTNNEEGIRHCDTSV